MNLGRQGQQSSDGGEGQLRPGAVVAGAVAHVRGAEADVDLPALVGALVTRRVRPDVVAPRQNPLLLRLLLEQLLKVLLRRND